MRLSPFPKSSSSSSSSSSLPSSTTTSCASAGSVTTALILSFLSLASPITASSHDSLAVENINDLYQQHILLPPVAAPRPSAPESSSHRFTLRHLFHHGAYRYPALHRRKDVLNREATLFLRADDDETEEADPLIASSWSEPIHRLVDRRPSVVDPIVAAQREHGQIFALSPSAWTIDNVNGPNITDKTTILSLAQMSADAYVENSDTGDWENVENGWNSTLDLGWESDGIRGHVFADESNSTIVISLKGTSVAVYDGIDTTTNDKENDNLFFSCCCGQQGSITHRKVCDCATATYACNDTCVTQSLIQENRYYAAARHLYSNITEIYPNANIWLTGHSLGGAISSFLGMTYGIPTVTFESPPDALAAGRLGLPAPPGSVGTSPQSRKYTGTYHFGHTADPLFLGTCTGASSLCSFAGYAMESSCHTGQECVYDVVADKGWRVGLGTHKIKSVIKDVLKVYDTVPSCVSTPECVDCPLWKRFHSNSSETTTSRSSSSTSHTRTRTATCQTPGWWGCLDETTTTGATTTRPITTTSSTTSTCKTPGWFGCRDETTTSTTHTATATATTTTATSTCQTPGWFGACLDTSTTTSTTTSRHNAPSTTMLITPAPPLPTATSPPLPPSSSTTCTSKDWSGFICVDPSPVPSSTPCGDSQEDCHDQKKCVKRGLFGRCKKWKPEDNTGSADDGYGERYGEM